jgi:catechol 2,3-dioxygenase-like lactoylglutathione lyase family enzyme
MRHSQSKIDRSRWVAVVAILSWLLTATLLAMSVQAAPTTRPAVAAVDHIAIVVSDADRAADFYAHVLNFKKETDRETWGRDLETLEGVFGARCRAICLSLGNESIDLVQYLAQPGKPIPADSHSYDGWFQHIAIITSDMDKAYASLRANHVRYVSTAPQRLPDWNPKAGGIKAFYFQDPDGHVLEILEFPPGKGEARWQRNDGLFLGIDHTAIVTSSTERSVAFYRDVLGLRIAGVSENWGEEQEHLNNVFGAHLRITTLRAASGPGVELLEYLTPRGGRPYPADSKSNDLFSWQTVMRSPDVHAASGELRNHHVQLISSTVVRDPLDSGNGSAIVARDPDGHAIELFESSSLFQASKP